MTDEQKRIYEIGFLTPTEEAVTEVVALLSRHDAEIIGKVLPSRKVVLGYQIKKHKEAYFTFILFSLPAPKVAELEGELLLNNNILRSLIVTAKENKEPAKPVLSAEANSDLAEPNPALTKGVETKEKEPLEMLSNEALEKKLEEILG